MAELKATTKTYIEVDYMDLEEFIADQYGFPYEIPCDMEWNNYTKHSIDVKKEKISEYDANEMAQWIISEGKKGSMMLDTILTDLCNRDILAAGVYLIDVFW